MAICIDCRKSFCNTCGRDKGQVACSACRSSTSAVIMSSPCLDEAVISKYSGYLSLTVNDGCQVYWYIENYGQPKLSSQSIPTSGLVSGEYTIQLISGTSKRSDKITL